MSRIFLVWILLLIQSGYFCQSRIQISDRKITKSTQTIQDDRKVHTLKEIVTYYNKKGDPVEIIERINGVFSQKILYSYNKNGDEKTNCHVDSLGNVIDIKTFYYDTFGNSLGYSLENANHEKQEELIIELNKFNDKISESIFDANHILKTKTIFVYDNKGLLIEKKTYNGNNELIYWKITNYE